MPSSLTFARLICVALVLIASPVDALAQTTIVNANVASLGNIPEGGVGGCQQPGATRDVTFTVAGIGA